MKKITDRLERLLEIGGTKKDIVLLAVSGVALLCSMLKVPMAFDPAWLSIILCGIPIIMEALIGLITAFDIKADVLVSLALIASVLIGEDFAAGEVAFIMQIGGLLEELTVARARAGIEKLVKLTPQTARVITDGGETIIPAEKVKAGAKIRVLPGETVPADGVVVSGQTSIDQAVMTGEPIPVDKTVGDEVTSGTVNQFGVFEMTAVKAGEDSSFQRMVRLVQTADAGKAKIVGMADRWATWIVVTALTAAALTWLISGQIIRAVTILVVFCPCSLVLATPTAIMAAIGNATSHGFLVKEGDALERLAMVSKICFDKTGTLTLGEPKVTAVESFSETLEKDDIYRLTAAAENSSEHPLGKAIVSCYELFSGRKADHAERFGMIPGKGVTAVSEGKRIIAGNLKMMKDHGLDTEKFSLNAKKYLEQGCTVIYVGIEGKAAGLIAVADVLREQMPETMRKITETGVDPVLLTGDNSKAANAIAHQLNISKVIAECLPEDKLNYIRESQENGHKICMIGDGVNDAPALKISYVGIAMSGVGSDIAVEAADIALIDDKIQELPHLLSLSKRMMKTIKVNLTFSMTLNFVAIILAITGVLDPVVGALVHNAGSVLVIISSAMLLKWKQKAR